MTKALPKAKKYPMEIKKPLLGLMTWSLGEKRAPTIRRKVFRELILASNKQNITAYVFSPESADWEKNQIYGSTLIQRKKGSYSWCDFWFPFPDVVYNKIPNRRIEKTSEVSEFIRRLKEDKKIPVFNPCFLEKLQSYEWLSSDPQIEKHLPETRPLSPSALKEMLDKYSSVYIKPKAGSLGKGIIRVNKVEGGYVCTIKTENGYQLFFKQRLESAIGHITNSSRCQRYLVQKGLDLAQYKKRVFDIRTLVQKDFKGEWHLTGAGVRVARENAHLTHVPNGGEIIPLKKVLASLHGMTEARVAGLTNRLIAMAESIPAVLEKASGLKFGEISLDIGIDKDFNIWLIEVNSKPFRFDEKKIKMLSRKRIIEYARYLSNRGVWKKG